MLNQVPQTMFWTAHLRKNVQVKSSQKAKYRPIWSHWIDPKFYFSQCNFLVKQKEAFSDIGAVTKMRQK